MYVLHKQMMASKILQNPPRIKFENFLAFSSAFLSSCLFLGNATAKSRATLNSMPARKNLDLSQINAK